MTDQLKTLRYANAMTDAELRIVDALPGIVDGLIARAGAGDIKAAVYLLDRVMGKAATAKGTPADERDGNSLVNLSEPPRPRIVIPDWDERWPEPPQAGQAEGCSTCRSSTGTAVPTSTGASVAGGE